MKEWLHIVPKEAPKGKGFFAWHHGGELIAIASANGGKVSIYDKAGRQHSSFGLEQSSEITAISWSEVGATLAVLQENGIVFLWRQNSIDQDPQRIDSQFKGSNLLMWSKHNVVAIGTCKGNVMLINCDTGDTIPIIGKHTGPILSGGWVHVNEGEETANSLLVLGGGDRMLTFSNIEGDTIDQIELGNEPLSMSFFEKSHDFLLSINIGGTLLYLYSLATRKTVFEEALKQNIVHQSFLNDGNILVACREGNIFVVSSESSCCERILSRLIVPVVSSLEGADFCPSSRMIATWGNKGDIHVYSYTGSQGGLSGPIFQTTTIAPICQTAFVGSCILCVSTITGAVFGFASMESSLYAFNECSLCLAYVSSFMVVDIVSIRLDKQDLRCKIDLEPKYLAMGEHHFAVANENRVILYWLNQGMCNCIFDKKLGNNVKQLSISPHVLAVLCEDDVRLFYFDGGSQKVENVVVNANSIDGDEHSQDQITTISMKRNVLVYGTKAGNLKLFSISCRNLCSSLGLEFHKHEMKHTTMNTFGDIIFIDASNSGYLLDLAVGPISINNFPPNWKSIVWNSHMKQAFHVVCNDGTILSFLYIRRSVKGPMILQLGPLLLEADGSTIIIPHTITVGQDNSPFYINSESIVCYSAKDSKAKSFHLPAYLDVSVGNFIDKKELMIEKFKACLATNQLKTALVLASKINTRSFWLGLGHKALECLDIKCAVAAYRGVGDAGMVSSLEQIVAVEEEMLLSGHVSLIMADYETAQSQFMASSTPVAAVEMNMDLGNWKEAAKLAMKISPNEQSKVTRKYAEHLARIGEHEKARRVLKALDYNDASATNLH